MPLPYPYQRVRDPLFVPVGYLRTEIRVEEPGQGQDAAGGVSQTWAPVLAAMAAVEFVSETTVFQASDFANEVTHRIVMQWPGGTLVRNGMRVRCVADGSLYLVQNAVNVRKANRVLWLFCVEINAANVADGEE